MNDYTYTRVGDVVKIHRVFQADIVLDEESVKLAIENVKNNRADYATEQAWEIHLSMYQGALAYFNEKVLL